jgi:hypothetical protein
MENISIYSEARNEYVKQLSTWVVPPLVEFFRDEYEQFSVTEGRGVMRAFQNFCAEVPRWNQDVIETNINKILDNCRCDYIEELMTAVFIAHTKMLTAIRVSSKQKKLSITLPKLDHFLHRVFTECARAFWKAPFLFADSGSAIDKQKNILQAESLCIDAVSGAVRSLLPVKNILRDYLDESDSDEEAIIDTKKKKSVKDDSDSEEEAPIPTAAPAPFGAKAVEEPIDIEAVELESQTPPATPKPQSSEKPAPVVIQKLDTAPTPPEPTVSNHEVMEIETKEHVKIEKLEASADPPKLMIDTEPAVHFTPYDTVFDENKPGVSEIRYAEKVSVEDKPPSNWGMMDDDDEDDEEVPKLSISSTSSSLGIDDVEDLDAPAVPFVSAVTPEEDIDEPLGATLDFESLE